MAAAATDKFTKVGSPGTATTLDAPGHTIGGTSLTVISTTNWPTSTGVIFAMDTVTLVDGEEVRDVGTYTEWEGVVASATSITGLVLRSGSDQNYPAGSTTRVYIPVAGSQNDRMVDGLIQEHNQDGTHSTITATAITATTGTFTNVVISGAATGEGWQPLGDVPDTVTANGNRSYDLVFNGNDLTDTVTPGMRLKLTRTVTAPTYAGGLFNGSSHYFTKTTPSGTLGTVTNNFTLMCDYEPTSYASMALMGRLDATPNNGIYMRVTASGQVGVVIHSGGAANYRAVDTYQSLPLNKKTHIAASWTGGTVVIYFDGVSVPVQAAQTGGTAPTTAGTGGDWSIGRGGAYAALYANGYISNVAVFDAVLTASTIKSYMSQKLAGNETNCIGAWALNNNGTDDNSAGNTVTATGGVSYTNNKAPFTQDVTNTSVTAGTTNYAIITKASFSTNTTLVVQVPEGDTIPTSGGVSAVSYSTQKVPYGFPAQRGKWAIKTINRIVASGTPSAATWFTPTNGGGITINVPVGEWQLGHKGSYQNSKADAVLDIWATLSTGGTTESNTLLSAHGEVSHGANFGSFGFTPSVSSEVSLSAVTPYYLNLKSSRSGTTLYVRDTVDCVVTAELAYL